MKHTSFITASAFAAVLALSAPASAQSRGRAVSRPAPSRGAVVGSAVSRVGPAPRISGRVGIAPYGFYRPYYPYGFGFRAGLYGYPFGYYGSYGYPYAFDYPYGYYGYASFGYGYPGYAAIPPAGYAAAVAERGYGYGGVRIQSADRKAQVFADGYYVGVVDDFDGSFQHLNLEAGAHRIQIKSANAPPLAFDVNVQPGQTITYRAGK